MNIDELIEKPYWIIDILPKQVPADQGGQYFKVERYYLNRIPLLCRKYSDMLLKLNCYYDMDVSHDGENWLRNPEPEAVEQGVEACFSEKASKSVLFVSLASEQVLMVIERDCTHMTIYNPKEELLELIRLLAASTGLFVWKPA